MLNVNVNITIELFGMHNLISAFQWTCLDQGLIYIFH